MKVVRGDTDKEVSEQLCDFVIDKANQAIETAGQFTVGVSGMNVMTCQTCEFI